MVKEFFARILEDQGPRKHEAHIPYKFIQESTDTNHHIYKTQLRA